MTESYNNDLEEDEVATGGSDMPTDFEAKLEVSGSFSKENIRNWRVF